MTRGAQTGRPGARSRRRGARSTWTSRRSRKTPPTGRGRTTANAGGQWTGRSIRSRSDPARRRFRSRPFSPTLPSAAGRPRSPIIPDRPSDQNMVRPPAYSRSWARRGRGTSARWPRSGVVPRTPSRTHECTDSPPPLRLRYPPTESSSEEFRLDGPFDTDGFKDGSIPTLPINASVNRPVLPDDLLVDFATYENFNPIGQRYSAQ
jgi:hypothetical protein